MEAVSDGGVVTQQPVSQPNLLRLLHAEALRLHDAQTGEQMEMTMRGGFFEECG